MSRYSYAICRATAGILPTNKNNTTLWKVSTNILIFCVCVSLQKVKFCNNNQKELVYRAVGPFVHIPLFSIETQENIVKKHQFF
jgi:hypothetical protein